jgi:pimeloyl-ACP methyl ester carboxylesterase
MQISAPGTYLKDTVTNGNITICYKAIGSGAPLVLLHGFSDQMESWQEMGYVNVLIKTGRRLVLIDQRGHGNSSRPHEVDAYKPEARTTDVVAVLDALNIERADVFGYSMGGWVALNLVRYYPLRINRLIVGACHPFGQSMAFYREAVATDIARWIEIVERLCGAMSEAWKARVRDSDIMALRAAAASDRQDISKSLADFTRPCLFYAGSDDPLRDSVTRCKSFFPDARFFAVPNCNHVTTLLRADLVLPAVNSFLEATDRPA